MLQAQIDLMLFSSIEIVKDVVDLEASAAAEVVPLDTRGILDLMLVMLQDVVADAVIAELGQVPSDVFLGHSQIITKSLSKTSHRPSSSILKTPKKR